MATRFTIAQLVAQADATLPDNNTQDISPVDVRDMVKNFLAAMKPSFATMRRDTSLLMALTPAPIVFQPYSVVSDSDAPEMQANLAGSITHQVASLGNSSVLDRVSFFIGVAGTAGAELTFTLYANGVATNILTRISTTGSSNVIVAFFSGLLPRTVDTVYDVRVSSTNSSNYTFSNGTFHVETVPVAA